MFRGSGLATFREVSQHVAVGDVAGVDHQSACSSYYPTKESCYLSILANLQG